MTTLSKQQRDALLAVKGEFLEKLADAVDRGDANSMKYAANQWRIRHNLEEKVAQTLIKKGEILEVDLDSLDEKIRKTNQERIAVGRQIGACGEFPEVNEALPSVEISTRTIVNRINAIKENNHALDHARDLALNSKKLVEESHPIVNSPARQPNEAKKTLTESSDEYLKAKDRLELLNSKEIIAKLEDHLKAVEMVNAAIRTNNIARDRKSKVDQLVTEYDSLTEQLRELEDQKAKVLSNA